MARVANGKKGVRAVVAGAGGFIGHHLVKALKAQGYWVRGVDVKRPEFESTAADEFLVADLRHFEHAARAVRGVDEVYQLAADMGGIGFITSHFAELSRNNILINAHMLEAARLANVTKYLYTSSACVYPGYLQRNGDIQGLKESDAVPAEPEKGYGWEKLFAEQLTEYYQEDYHLDARIVRLHNIYGPLGTYEGGREKAPAAICRKVAEAEDGSAIEVWGDGQQTRSFCFVDDCVQGLTRLMASDHRAPINLGTEELVTITQLVDTVSAVAGKTIEREHDLTKPQGVRGRNSDNAVLRKALGWEPRTTLRQGIERTYPWIFAELEKKARAKAPAVKSVVARPGRKVSAAQPK